MDNNSEKYIPEKLIWTHEDYEQMRWHDCPIYGIAFPNFNESFKTDLRFDIDYIFKWVKPIAPASNNYYKFWISPCTLSFTNTFDLQVRLDTQGGISSILEIEDIGLTNVIEQEPHIFIYEWYIGLQSGNIRLKSRGFEQIVKQPLILINIQAIGLEERGCINFSLSPYNT